MSVFVRPCLLVLLGSFVLSACSTVQPGRSIGREVDDMNASLNIKSSFLRAEGYDLDRIDVEVTEGVALLTGETARDQDRVYAECMAWSSPSVRSVVNEVEVGEWRTRTQGARDGWITQQVRSRLLQDRAVRSLNYNIETRRGTVFLLGFARSPDERTRAATHASLVSGVQEVVDLTRIRHSEDDLPARGELAADACEPVRIAEGLVTEPETANAPMQQAEPQAPAPQVSQ